MAFRRDGQHGGQRRQPGTRPSASDPRPRPAGDGDFKAQLLAEAAETNRLLKKIEQGISALLRQHTDPYADAFGDQPKAVAEERALLERRFGIAFDKLSDAEVNAFVARLSQEQQSHFKIGDKHAVKFPIMRLMAEDAAAKPR